MNGRFVTLDGLRGVAALAVLLYHMRNLGFLPLAHGYVAVDLFFVLSGFVLSGAYSTRFQDGLSVKTFLWARAKRLYPLFALGMLLGMGIYCALNWRLALVSGTLGLALLPTPGSAALYYVNPPSWSLINELLINALLAAVLWHLRDRWLIAICCLAALALVVAFSIYGNLDGGPFYNDAWVGWARVCYAFPLGMLLHRAFEAHRLGRFRIKSRWSATTLPVLLIVAFLGWNDLLVVLIVLPVFVVLGAMVEPKAAPIWKLLGDISYPLYCIQFPLIQVVAFVARKSGNPAVTAALGALALIVFAWMALRADEWVRRRLAVSRAVNKPTVPA